jgi:serpin B
MLLLAITMTYADVQDISGISSLSQQDETESEIHSSGTLTDQKSIITANNRFSHDIYHALARDPQNADKNLFFSPVSIFSALALTYEGARNSTADEISSVCYLPKDDTVRRSGYHDMNNAINTSNSGNILKNANALWAENSYIFLPGYRALAEQWYGATVTNLDIIHNAVKSAREINTWVEGKTEGKIPDLVSSLSPETRLVITNAIYFKGLWEQQFVETKTYNGLFNVSPDLFVPARMMFNNADYGYLETSDLQILELPYKKGDGRQLSMLIILPKDNNLTAAEQILNPGDLTEIQNSLAKEEVDVHIPKFTMTQDYNLGSTLSALGMPTAFSNKADFSGMDGSHNLFIDDVIHKSFIEVNEKGTEAAAATSTLFKLAMLQRHPVFKADHPFVFLIQDKENGIILFAGRIVNPAIS